VLLVATAAFGCTSPRSPDRSSSSAAWNVLLITLDTVRADHLPCYGYALDTAPNICGLARKGVLFTNAVSQSSWTLPAHASILSGLYPHAHRAETIRSRIDKSAPSLAWILKRRGYSTGAIVSARFLNGAYGFRKGFQYFDTSLIRRGIHNVFADRITDKALDWIGAQSGAFFLWLHYYDPHHAFLRHPSGLPYSTASGDREIDYAGWNERPTPTPAAARFEEHRETLTSLYDGEIYFTDQQIGRLLARLDATHRLQRTLVILTSDHGESFGDHELFGHDNVLYQGLLRVPLIVRVPGRLRPEVNGTLQETRDIFQTVLSLLGVESESASGYNMLSDGRDCAYAEVSNRNPHRSVAVVQGTWKLIYTFDGTVELYDLVADPGEITNAAEANPGVVRRLLKRLSDDLDLAVIDDQTVEQLRALGYLN
jgi:arylsulfatase A-like enzyme